MKFRIHFELADGHEDFIVIHADTLDEIRQQAEQEIHKRGGLNPWSEEI